MCSRSRSSRIFRRTSCIARRWGSLPLAAWLRGPLKDRLRERLLGADAEQGGIFSRASVERLVQQHTTGSRDHSSILWAMLMLDASLQKLGAKGAALA